MVETFVQSTDDVIKFLKDQHNLIKDMFEEVLSASSDEARDKAFTELRQLLAVHETAEEMVVHPRARNELKDGDAIVDALLKEEHDAKEQLSKLEKLDVSSKEFIDELAKFRDAVVDHADHEENEEFNKLQRHLHYDDLGRMAKAVLAAEAIAPTRPHAGVESAKLNFAVGPFASMLDRARDTIGQVVATRTDNHDLPNATMQIELKSNTRTVVQLHPGQRLEVSLAERPSSGYIWQLRYVPRSVALSDDGSADQKLRRDRHKKLRYGSEVNRMFYFRAKGQSATISPDEQADIVFELKRPWESNLPPKAAAAVNIHLAATHAVTGRSMTQY